MLIRRRSGSIVEVGREVGDHQDPERLGDLAGHGVVFLDRLVLIAQVLLDHVLHVFGEIGQALLDVLRLGPDAAGDQELVISARCMKAAKFSPRPTGSTIVNRTLPGGTDVR